MTKESRGYLRDIKKMGENAKRPVEMYVEGDLTTTSLTLKSSKVESSKITMTKYGINFETPLKTKTNYINIGDKSNINIDLSLSQIHYLELNKDLLIDEFLNYDEGVDYYLITKQDETGGHDLDFNYDKYENIYIKEKENNGETIPAATEIHPRWDDSMNANVYGVDTFKLNILPGGLRNGSNGTYSFIGSLNQWWTSTFDNPTTILSTAFSYDFSYALPSNGTIRSGYSIRLVRDYVVGDGTKEDGRILPSIFTDFNGNTYDGVIIGDQVWSTSNLKATSYLNGDPIPTGFNNVDWSNLTSGAYAVYDHTLVDGINSEQEMIEAYGILYNGYVVSDIRGLSPEGHIPTESEFYQALYYIIGVYPEITKLNVGDNLKSIRQVNSPYEIIIPATQSIYKLYKIKYLNKNLYIDIIGSVTN